MNRQKIFDNAVRGIFEQGGPAGNSYQSCMYRSPDGKKCAVGWSIPDAAYAEDLEGRVPGVHTIDGRPNLIARLLGAETEEDALFLRNIQIFLHDAFSERDNFIDRMLSAASVFAVMEKLDSYVVEVCEEKLLEERHNAKQTQQ